jgi:cytochrome c553
MKRMLATVGAVVTLVAGAGPGCAPSGPPPSAKGKPEAPAELRAAYATVSDIAEGRRLAETCARCHGANGVSASKGVPNVAGQRPAYLDAKLRAYQAGTRGDHGMEGAVRFLSDDALMKVAAYYASLEPAPPLAPAGAKAAARPDPVAAGKAAAAACAACHGEGGVSRTAGTPNLVGFDPKAFIAAMNAYKSGQRRHDLMKSLASALSDADLGNLALHYAMQKPERAQTRVPAGDPAAGKAAAAACSGCHGEQGVSANPANPSLAGQDAEYFAAAMRAYKEGTRADEAMKGVAAGLDERAIADLAAYYAAQQPQPPKVEKPLTTAEWAQRCDRCHGVNGNSTDPRVPALSAQRADYLEKSLQAYRSGARKDSPMAAMTSSLAQADIEGLADHYARQRARAFVYIALPCN